MIETKNRLCPQCKSELTDEEMAINAKTCWFCLAGYLKKLGEEASIPPPDKLGHPDGFTELEKLEKVASLERLKVTQAVEQDIVPSVPISEEERKKMIVTFGFDPNAAIPVTLITVKGKNDDTYLQLSVRGNISPEIKKEIERWLRSMLDLVGTVLTFGTSFAGTILQMKMFPGAEMFLKP